MVDFKKKLSGKSKSKAIEPVSLYETLDRAHDKGPLRPAQLHVLQQWFSNHRNDKNLIVKLHTGQGKTLIGLLMLQSKINEGKGPALYLCPDNYLIEQTCDQARQFGIQTCQANPEIPEEFSTGTVILVTSVQKLFNGLTKFGLRNKATNVTTVLMDDAHACADTIREACRIRITHDEPAYQALLGLFAAELEAQGVGTYADICNGSRDAILPVPYWAWAACESEIANILSHEKERKSIKFAWPIVKDIIRYCQCIVSGAAIEIEPYIAPLSIFGSYTDAESRIFMSATVTDDAFLVKGLELTTETITNPLTYPKERWSGEKMILMPSTIHRDLDRESIVRKFAPPDSKRTSGTVALATSFARIGDWEAYGAIVAKKDTVAKEITRLRSGSFEKVLVLVNRYDGIDLPDDMCRVLLLDGKPFSESLIDLHEESCRVDSVATLMRTVRTVEQGMGRSVRGEKDYSVVIAVGADLVRLLRDKESRKYLSPQMSKQIEIGLEISDLAQQEIEGGDTPDEAFTKLVRQSTRRDDDWKDFYVDRMEQIKPAPANQTVLQTYAAELEAEKAYQAGDYGSAVATLQGHLDKGTVDKADKGWYLQTLARYHYLADKPTSQIQQIAAHNANRLLLKPRDGIKVTKLALVSQGRMERIIKWMRNFETYEQLDIRLSDILARLVFGMKADKFESALDDLSRAIGFAGERPDKEWKEGPDNLWALDDTQYVVWECKSEVELDRAEINKRESEQMNRSTAWFRKHYAGAVSKNIIVHPTNIESTAASFLDSVEVTRDSELKKFVKNVKFFFKSFESKNFKDLSAAHVQELVDLHGLSIDAVLMIYSKKVRKSS